MTNTSNHNGRLTNWALGIFGGLFTSSLLGMGHLTLRTADKLSNLEGRMESLPARIEALERRADENQRELLQRLDKIEKLWQ